MVMILNIAEHYRTILRDFDGRSRGNGIDDRPLGPGFRAIAPISVTGVLRSAPVPPQRSSRDNIFDPFPRAGTTPLSAIGKHDAGLRSAAVAESDPAQQPGPHLVERVLPRHTRIFLTRR